MNALYSMEFMYEQDLRYMFLPLAALSHAISTFNP